MKLSIAITASVSAEKQKSSKTSESPPWKQNDFGIHGDQGVYGDLVVAPWQVEPLVKLGYDADKLQVNKYASKTPPTGRGVIKNPYAETWSEIDFDGKYVVPYAIQDTVPADKWQQIHDELADFTLAMGCVKFVYDPDFTYDAGVHIAGEHSTGTHCWSFVGVCRGTCDNGGERFGFVEGIHPGWQAIRLPNWCINVGGIHHEFLHAIGYLHEQDRPDWPNYITGETEEGGGVGLIANHTWLNTGHPFEPASNVMYDGFVLLNGRSYSPHPLLTTTDAEQGYALYCDGKHDTHPMEPRSKCLEPDEVDVIRPVFNHRFCDGFKDCLDGEDEDGRLANCDDSGPKTCCQALVAFGGDTYCPATGEKYNGKDVYDCSPNEYLGEIRWETDKGWVICKSENRGGCDSHWSWTGNTPDDACFGDNGELSEGYTFPHGPNIKFICQREVGGGGGIPTPCADHNCADNERCVNDADGNGFTCECRDPANSPCSSTTPESPTDSAMDRLELIQAHLNRIFDSFSEREKYSRRYIGRMTKILNKMKASETGESCYAKNGFESEAADLQVFDADNMCKLNGQVNAAINSWARNWACSGRGRVHRQIIRAARKVRNFYDDRFC